MARTIDAGVLGKALSEWCSREFEYFKATHGATPKVVSDTLRKVINMIADQPTIDCAPKWISVKDRLPDTTDVYLVNAVHRYNKSDGYRSPQVRLFFKDDNEWHGLPDLYIITHWMPLPSPPKGE